MDEIEGNRGKEENPHRDKGNLKSSEVANEFSRIKGDSDVGSQPDRG